MVVSLAARRFFFIIGTLCALPFVACNVPEPAGSTGGVHVKPQGDADAGSGSCGRGVVVVENPDDYSSTNVALVGLDGAVLSESFISSATSSVGLTPPLGTDVVVPLQPSFGKEIVLIDQLPLSTLVWVDAETATVTRRLSVATGFASNPWDYAEIDANKAYVTRFDQNTAPGQEPFDAGSDVLIVDPSQSEIVASIDMRQALGGDSADFLPRPDKIVLSGDRAFILLGGWNQAFSAATSARIVTVDTKSDSIADVLVLEGLRNCPGLAQSPDSRHLAVSCAGDGTDPMLGDSAIAIVNIVDRATEEKRFASSEFGDDPIGYYAAYASAERLMFVTWGRFASAGLPARGDRLIELDVESGDHRVLADSGSSPFVFGEVRCATACGVCFAADATPGAAALQRYAINADGSGGVKTSITVEQRYGMSPRYVGRF